MCRGKLRHLSFLQPLIAEILNAALCYPILEPRFNFDLSSLSLWQPPQHCDNDKRKKLMKLTAVKDTQLAGEEEERDTQRWGGVALLAGREQRLLNRGPVIAARLHQAQLSPALLIPRLHLQRLPPQPSGLGRAPFSKWGSDVIF